MKPGDILKNISSPWKTQPVLSQRGGQQSKPSLQMRPMFNCSRKVKKKSYCHLIRTCTLTGYNMSYKKIKVVQHNNKNVRKDHTNMSVYQSNEFFSGELPRTFRTKPMQKSSFSRLVLPGIEIQDLHIQCPLC